ncbi:MAG TPA: histidine kinase [Chitinophagaceae bacterium]
MKHILSFLVLLLTACPPAWSQQWIAQLKPDSMEKVLQTARDTQRVNTLNLLGRRYLYADLDLVGIDSVKAMADEALALAQKHRYPRGIGNSLLNLGIISVYRGNYAEGLTALNTARHLTRQSGDLYALAAAYDFTGLGSQQKGESRTAITFFDSAQAQYRQLGDTITAVWSMLNKGGAYFTLGDYPNAYKTHQTAYDLTPEKDTTLKINSLYYLATLFLGAGLPELTLEQVDKVLAFFPGKDIAEKRAIRQDAISALLLGGEAYLQLGRVDSAQKIAAITGPPMHDQNVFHNMFWGRLLNAQGQYGKSLPYLEEGLALAEQYKQPIFVARLAREVACAHLGLKDYNRALRYATQALTTAEKIEALLEQTNAAGTLSEIYDAMGDNNKAYQYSKLHKRLNDSLMPEDYKRKLAMVRVQNELAIQKREAALLASEARHKEQQLKREALIRNLLLGGLLLLVVTGVIVYRNITLQRNNEKLRLNHQLQIQQFEAEHTKSKLQKHAADLEMQALRAQMNPHFIFNCLNAINHFILKNETEIASDYLTKFARLIRMVLQSSSQKYIPLHDELETLKLYIGMESVRFRNHFSYTLHCHPSVEIEMMQIPPMLLQPFVENAIWHGLMHRTEGGKLTIDIEEQGGLLQCTIQDNGIGRSKAAELKSKSASFKKSMGMEITANRLQLLYNGNGSGANALNIVDLQDENGEALGTRVVLRIPIKMVEVETV